MDAIVFDGRTLWLAVPDSDRTRGPWFEHDFADCVADQLCDAASRPRGGLPQGIKLFLAEVNLGLFHICQLITLLTYVNFGASCMTITNPNDFCYPSGRRSPAEVLGHGGHRFRHRERLRHDDQRDGDFSSAESLLLSRIRSADYGHRDDNRY